MDNAGERVGTMMDAILPNMDMPKELEPTERMNVILPNGSTITLPVCQPFFPAWNGSPIGFDYGSKPVLDHNGEPCFAELVILRLLIEHGWDGVWVETYGGTHFLRTMPREWNLESEHVLIPVDKERLLKTIWKAAKTSACFDVFVWRGDQVLFCEAKRVGKDRFTAAQVHFIEGALACGIPQESLIVVEWSEAVA